jgi:hypothetical protein
MINSKLIESMPLKREIGDMVEYVDNIFKDAIKK